MSIGKKIPMVGLRIIFLLNYWQSKPVGKERFPGKLCSGGMLVDGQGRSRKHGNDPGHRDKQVHCRFTAVLPRSPWWSLLTKTECFEITVFLLDKIIIKYIWPMEFNIVWRKRRKCVSKCSAFAEA